MKNNLHHLPFKNAWSGLFAAGIFVAGLNPTSAAPLVVDSTSHAAHVAAGTMPPDAPASASAPLVDPALALQFSELQAKMARLETALAKTAPPAVVAPAGTAMAGMSAAAPPMGMAKMKGPGKMAGMASANGASAPAMPGMVMPATVAPPAPAMGMMGMMDKMMGMMDQMMPMAPAGGPMVPGSMPAAPAMPAGGMSMMTMDKMEMAGMMGMAPMAGSAPGVMPQSALPGFPGASHLYHIGAIDFFLDHPQHITLSTEQTAALNQVKEQALLAKSAADRAIGQSEQELWTLTSSDQPDAAKIEAKIRQTEKLTGDARLAFIRAVGDASKLLTEEQRKILTGFATPAPAMTTAGVPAPMPPMKDM